MTGIAEMRSAAASEGARRATGEAAAGGPIAAPDPEVTERATRRRFTAEYKLRILHEAEACKGNGALGRLLRREGLYSSHLSTWRQRRDAIARVSLAPKKRGRPAKTVDPRVKQLERENARLTRRLERAEAIIEIQKKASELLGIPLKPLDNGERD